MVTVGVVDYGLNNLKSICRALELVGADRVIQCATPSEAAEASHLVLPGVGAFGAAMKNLVERGWASQLQSKDDSRPMLGICLGMQLMFQSSDESPGVAGLGLLAGHVTSLSLLGPGKVPHVGWNEVVSSQADGLVTAADGSNDYYFVHSFAVPPDVPSTFCETPWANGTFTSVVAHGRLFGTQFHPEKSSHVGLRLLDRFVRM